MNFPSIDIQGSILSTDILAKIRTEQALFQLGKDFNPALSNSRLKDEISLAWQEAKGQWMIYKSKLSRLSDGETGTTETRNFWIVPLLTNLGYNLEFDRKVEELNGKPFHIGFRDRTLDDFPVYIGGFHESLDKRPENKHLRVSPHAMVQEYLNYSEHLYGIVSNGRQIRLLRDASRVTRLSYLEFNLEKMMEEDLYADFVIFFRVMHSSRMPRSKDGSADSIIEKYHQDGLAAGSAIRNKLGAALKGGASDKQKGAIELLANEFLNNPHNVELRNAYLNGQINTDEYFKQMLRIVYRMLFLFVIEERNLVFGDSKTPETKRFNQIYYNHFSLLRLRKLARKLLPPEANRHNDLWQSLVSTFSLFEKKEIGEKLGIMALQGDLFGYNAICSNGYDLHRCHLNNAVLLNVIRSLSFFENDNGVLVAVNYGGLDVEEFGSVYEDLLELKLVISKIEGSDLYNCAFDRSDERSKSGSHYTPEELVQPLIKHSLEYLIEDILQRYYQKKASREDTIKALLKLKVCDVACGSGHILLSAARRIALAVARVTTDEEQPNPSAIRKAMKDVVRNCIYGVDKNPLAVELCKIALWLEAYNPGEPLSFLDHHIKCGDAIVGLAHRSELENGIADEAFKTLPGDDKDIAKTWRDKNVKERRERAAKALQLKADFEKSTEHSVQEAMAEYSTFNQLPEATPEDIDKKARAYKKFIDGKGYTFLKAMADTQVAQFFIPKTDANKEYLMTDADYRLILSGYKGWQDRKIAKATAVALEQRFFHWFIEFPVVLNEGGFDCILGNPPYLGGSKISSQYGDVYYNLLKYLYPSTKGICDLAAFFLLRDFNIIKLDGYLALITTNSISQGDTRESGLDHILSINGKINFAIKSMPWPGVANLNVSLFTCVKHSNAKISCLLENKKVDFITSYFDNLTSDFKPEIILSNSDLSFDGTKIYGDGFIINRDVKTSLLESNVENGKVIFEYLGGEDINDSPDSSASRWVINFFDWNIEKASTFVEPFEIVKAKVKPYRDTDKREKTKRLYWQYERRRVRLYERIDEVKTFFVATKTSKYLSFTKQSLGKVFSSALVVITSPNFSMFSFLQSNFHLLWVQKNSSTLETRLRYTGTDSFETFPFPKNLSQTLEQSLESIGEACHEHRRQLMLNIQLGLTKTYNLFHSNAITAQAVNEKDKQVAALQKQLEKTPGTISFNEAIQGILKLRELHVQMDEAVLDAYGWNDIALRHDFYEVDYLPENDRIRFTIHPDARREVLKRLLELNHKIHAEEVKAGLWNKKPSKGKNKGGDPEDNDDEDETSGYGGLFG